MSSDDGRPWVKQNSWHGHASPNYSRRSLTPTFDLLMGECRAARETIFLILGSFRLKLPYWNMTSWNFIYFILFDICYFLYLDQVLYNIFFLLDICSFSYTYINSFTCLEMLMNDMYSLAFWFWIVIDLWSPLCRNKGHGQGHLCI